MSLATRRLMREEERVEMFTAAGRSGGEGGWEG